MTIPTTAPKRPSFTPGGPRQYRPLAPLVDPVQPWEDPEEIALVLASAKVCVEQWGEFASMHNRMRMMSTYGTLSQRQYFYLKRLVDATRARAAGHASTMASNLHRGDTSMSDAEVAAGVRYLSIDGWDAFDRPAGLYSLAMLAMDYSVAIAGARTIIGKYRKTLEKAGVVAS